MSPRSVPNKEDVQCSSRLLEKVKKGCELSSSFHPVYGLSLQELLSTHRPELYTKEDWPGNFTVWIALITG